MGGKIQCYFSVSLGLGLIVALFVSTPKIPVGTNQNNNQTAREALKEAFSNKSYIYLTLGFLYAVGILL